MTRSEMVKRVKAAIDKAMGLSGQGSSRADIDDLGMIADQVMHELIDSGAIRSFIATHWHRERGSSYQRMADGIVQTAVPLKDMDAVVIYRGTDGQHWVRPPAEFNDGRFEVVKNGG